MSVIKLNKLYYLNDFLSPEEISLYIDKVTPGSNGKIVKNPEINTSLILEKINNLFPNKFTKISDDITYSCDNIPIGKHIDTKISDFNWKLGIYLNTVKNGGTIFYIDKERIKVDNKAGNAFLFDITLKHESEIFSKNDIKKVIGFRLYS